MVTLPFIKKRETINYLAKHKPKMIYFHALNATWDYLN